jgi:hypothetical protein
LNILLSNKHVYASTYLDNFLFAYAPMPFFAAGTFIARDKVGTEVYIDLLETLGLVTNGYEQAPFT